MGRPQTFETASVVRAARAVFWRDGYEEASLPELEQATGLSRSSIYHAFGSKRGLFDAAVESYLDEVVRPRLRPLTAAVVAPTAIVDYLVGLRAALAQSGSLPATSGCLLINAAVAPVGRDDAVRRVVAAYRAELRAALGRGVTAHLPDGAPAELERLTDTLTGLVVAALALTRVDRSGALHLLGTALELIPGAAVPPLPGEVHDPADPGTAAPPAPAAAASR